MCGELTVGIGDEAEVGAQRPINFTLQYLVNVNNFTNAIMIACDLSMLL